MYEGSNKFKNLSWRQKQVALLVSLGYQMGEIAQALNLTKETIHTHNKRIREKLSSRGIADTVRITMQSVTLEKAKSKYLPFLSLVFLSMQINIMVNDNTDALRITRTTKTVKTCRSRKQIKY